jgi:HSP20 family protein
MSLLNTLIPALNREGTGNAAAPARRPRYTVDETDTAYRLTLQMPGVAKGGLEITDEGGVLRILGKVDSRLPEGAEILHRESSEGSFELVLEHDASVDAEKTGAELKDGVLELTLPKSESARPRKISVS